MEKLQVKNRLETHEEVDFIGLSKVIWNSKRTIAIIMGLFFLMGFFIAILSEPKFSASSVFVPQSNESNRGAVGGLASIAGINLGGMGPTSEIPPSLYPRMINSVKVQRELLNAPITIEDEDIQTTYQEYYEDYYNPGALSFIRKYTLGLPGTILRGLRSSSGVNTLQDKEGEEFSTEIIRLLPNEVGHFQRLSSQISVKPSDKESVVELTFTMPEPLMAAQMAKFAQDLLQREVIAYKISNAKEQLMFTEQRYNEKKEEFESSQTRLAIFRDRNQNISSAMAMNQLQRLEAEYNFAFNIYTEIAKQLEQARLQVSKDTPIFSIIEPVTIPTEKSAPNRGLILVVFTVVGAFLGFGYVIVRELFKKVKEQW